MIFFFLYLNSDGTGDIHKEFFGDENFLYQHSKSGLLSMSNNTPDTNCSQFCITTAAAPSLNDNFVFFGEVIDGMEVVKKIESCYDSSLDVPSATIFIRECGIVT
ncbi:unnamed protein product [Rotaria socialis]|uniref:Peptidyl-prolyl cis-trans isomerase n=1 Tax=Rotaria socialis TaxID=392032 RepID=A0A817X865_9BILA|nr:unnamed protein product [Rotaria socialis]CAF3364474.1 unnamed protein product [Rotaria socialis]CAF4609619.1 unnamed protein product [Rotaria socialis]